LFIPIGLLVMLAMWGAFESGRKFRREFRQRGKGWAEACAAMDAGRGILVIDTVWGPQRGLGHPAVWWLEERAVDAELSARIETGGSARLVKCPGRMRNADALRQRFGVDRVITHGWSLAGTLVDNRT
jgi:hypothetical protein